VIKIGWDLDGVIMHTQPMFRAMIYNRFKTYDVDHKDDRGNVLFKYAVEGESDQKVWNVIHEVLRNYQPFCEPVYEAMYVIHEIWHITHQPLTIITARPKDVERQTHEWLEANLDCDYDLYIVDPPKNGQSPDKNVKSVLVDELELDWFVEDRFKYASQIAKECEGIERIYLLNREYNRGRRTAEKVKRVDNLFVVLSDLQERLTFGTT